MAKFHLDRLREKYGWKTAVKRGQISGQRYGSLINEILTTNNENIQRATMRLSKDNIDKYSKNLSTKEKRFVLPDVSDVFPKRSVFLLKSAEQGQLLTDSLRDKLTKDLRETLSTEGYIRETGTLAGTINPKAIQDFEDKISNTFLNYTKKDPSYGVPSNIHVIAVTEVRTNVGQAKHEYMKSVQKKNGDAVAITKTWVQNRSQSKNPRSTHAGLNGKTIGFDKLFTWKSEKGMTVSAPHPHAQGLPAGEVISCHCDITYRIKKVG